uniref:Chromo domain-containing protein n=1 Tax=Xenopus tropicalis TaxID=8364 RepID=A0A803KEW4_XENTR
MGTDLSFSSAYHPQTNGQTERTNQSLEQYLRCYISSNQSLWAEFLPWAEFAFNNSTHSSTGESPFFVVFGYHPRVFSFSTTSSDVPAVDSLVNQFSSIWQRVQESLSTAVAIQKKAFDKHHKASPEYQVGDKVWLSSRNVPLKVSSSKFAPKYIGPFSVSEVINPNTVRLELPPELKISNSFHVSLLKPARVVRQRSPPPPVSVEGQAEYAIQRLVDSRLSRGRLQYLVYWKGYGPEERSWVPASDVRADRLVRQFHVRFPDKPRGPVAPSGGGGNVTIPGGLVGRRGRPPPPPVRGRPPMPSRRARAPRSAVYAHARS